MPGQSPGPQNYTGDPPAGAVDAGNGAGVCLTAKTEAFGHQTKRVLVGDVEIPCGGLDGEDEEEEEESQMGRCRHFFRWLQCPELAGVFIRGWIVVYTAVLKALIFCTVSIRC